CLPGLSLSTSQHVSSRLAKRESGRGQTVSWGRGLGDGSSAHKKRPRLGNPWTSHPSSSSRFFKMKQYLLVITLSSLSLVNARHHHKYLSAIMQAPGEAPAGEEGHALTRLADPLFHTVALTASNSNFDEQLHSRYGRVMPIHAIITENEAPTTISINFTAGEAPPLPHLEATFVFTHGEWKHTLRYAVDVEMGKWCKDVSRDRTVMLCMPGPGTLGPLLLPSFSDFPSLTHFRTISASLQIHFSTGQLVLQASFDLEVRPAPPTPARDDEYDFFQ
ncbi:hypothetical protein PENTCL1PPCAC_326, partial [Pristionchus entomophagus]